MPPRPEVGDVGDLWDGADVRWVPEATTRGGVRLRPGDRAVVVDAGRHHVRSFATPGRGRWRRPRLVIELASGAQMRVRRDEIELVAPDHPLRPEPDAARAAWWLDQLAPWDAHTVGVLVPASFPAVCGVANGADGGEGELDLATARVLVDHFAAATTTPDDVHVAVWEGWGDLPPQRFPGAARLPTEARGHLLLRGPLTGVLRSVGVGPADRLAVAGSWWPADRAWFVAGDVDLAWTYVAGSAALVDAIVADPRVDAHLTALDRAVTAWPEPR
ncbi:hypothetical protein FTX61_12585 [Nitriliruptoraceae bacterium ZYF776]|nr:hypothetical protein [Profundirhabdus halotolerans]